MMTEVLAPSIQIEFILKATLSAMTLLTDAAGFSDLASKVGRSPLDLRQVDSLAFGLIVWR
jgi:hypothetical protein